MYHTDGQEVPVIVGWFVVSRFEDSEIVVEVGHWNIMNIKQGQSSSLHLHFKVLVKMHCPLFQSLLWSAIRLYMVL